MPIFVSYGYSKILAFLENVVHSVVDNINVKSILDRNGRDIVLIKMIFQF